MALSAEQKTLLADHWPNTWSDKPIETWAQILGISVEEILNIKK